MDKFFKNMLGVGAAASALGVQAQEAPKESSALHEGAAATHAPAPRTFENLKTREGSVNFAKVEWARQAVTHELALLDKRPFDVNNQRKDHVAQFIEESEQPFAEVILNPEKLKALDLNDAEWNVIAQNFTDLTENNAKLAHIFELKTASPKTKIIEGAILGKGEDLSAYGTLMTPAANRMKELVERAKILTSEVRARSITPGDFAEGVEFIKREFNDVLKSGLSTDESKAAHYFDAQIQKEFRNQKNISQMNDDAAFTLPGEQITQ